MFFEHLGVQFDDVGWLGIQTDDVDATRQRLQISVRTRFAEKIHYVESVFAAIEVACLEACAASCFEPAYASIIGGLNRRHEILRVNSRTVYRLETVAERCAHHLHLFLGHLGNSSIGYLQIV